MSDTYYPQPPTEGSNDPDPSEPSVPETPEPEAEPDESAPSEETPETTDDEVSRDENDPTHSAQPGDESGLSMEEVVKQVMAGDWGNGQQQRNRLSAAGYDALAVHDAVVERLNANRNT